MLTMVSSGAQSRPSRTACGLGNRKITIFCIFESGPPLLGTNLNLLSIYFIILTFNFFGRSHVLSEKWIRPRFISPTESGLKCCNSEWTCSWGPQCIRTGELQHVTATVLSSITSKMIESLSEYMDYGRYLP